MCLIAFLLQPEPQGRFVLASNRDEFWSRPTQPLDAWAGSSHTRIYSGRDGLAGGTWVGVSGTGRVAFLTNVRSAGAEAAPSSRGELTTRWLAHAVADTYEFVKATHPSAYAGFNLVLGDLASPDPWVWLSNTAPADGCFQHNSLPLALPLGWWGRLLLPGVHTLSNASLNSPWPKSLRLATTLAQTAALGANDWARQQDKLLAELMSMQRAPNEQLPLTGVPMDLEQGLSSPFVYLPERGYGTRSTLLIQANHLGAELCEWTHSPEAADPGKHQHCATWPIEGSTYKRISISTWGMPASS